MTDADRYCVTREDGECISTDPRCMHQPIDPTRYQFSVEWKIKGQEWQHRHFHDEGNAATFYIACKHLDSLAVVKLRRRVLNPWQTVVEHRPDQH